MSPASTKKESKRLTRTDWMEISKLVVQLAWPIIAVVLFFKLYPELHKMLEAGNITKLSIGFVQVELGKFPHPDNVRDVQNAKELVPFLTDAQRKSLSERFEKSADKTHGANILWVDDNNPYANVLERRVLIAAGINIDLARSTKEAFKWLEQGKYDVLITDLRRENELENPTMMCYPGSPLPPNAGCKLLITLGDCFKHRSSPELPFDCNGSRIFVQNKMPKSLVYSAGIESDFGSPPYSVGMTSEAGGLFGFVLNALQERDLKH